MPRSYSLCIRYQIAKLLVWMRSSADNTFVKCSWCSVLQSTFMKLVEAEMLLLAAGKQLHDMGPNAAGSLHDEYMTLIKKLRNKEHGGKELSPHEWQRLQALASPRLLTVWFNSWQYLNEEQVWGGLVVEVTQRLEEKLGTQQRRLMRGWWVLVDPWRWLQLLLTPMRMCTAFAYNLKVRRWEVMLRCILPLLLVLAAVATGVGIGIQELGALGQGAVKSTSPSPSPSPTAPAPPSAVTSMNVTVKSGEDTENWRETQVRYEGSGMLD